MTAVPCPRKLQSDAERWSLAALVLAAIGLLLSIWLIYRSETDPVQVRWWLVVLPLVISAVPVLIPRHRVRFAAALVLGGWCFLTGFSIGLLLVPALVAAVAAVVREEP